MGAARVAPMTDRKTRTGAIALMSCLLAGCAGDLSPVHTPMIDGGAASTGAMGQSLSGNYASGSPPVSASPTHATAEATGTGAERAFATAILTDLQRRSFAENREYCGYLGRDAAGAFVTTRHAAGDEASCYLPAIPQGMVVLASYHTHGTYSPLYASEYPTTDDMETDRIDDIDGYIATPGGRLWYVDSDTMTVRQLCGVGCLPQDPRYRPDEAGEIRSAYTYRELQARERY